MAEHKEKAAWVPDDHKSIKLALDETLYFQSCAR